MPLDQLFAFITSRRESRFALVGHPRPDGDSLGSTIGLARVLRRAGYIVDVVNARPLSDRYRFLAEDGIIKNYDAPDWHTQYDCIGIMDCGDLERLDEYNRLAAQTLPAFTIDHHASSAGIGEAVWIEPTASSTCEMVVRLAQASGWEIPPDAANALWTGIVTDTGRFCFENTTPLALEAARVCVAAGARPTEVADNVYLSFSLGERRLQALVIDRAEIREGVKFALSWLTHEDLARVGMGIEGAQDLVNLIRHVIGVEVAVFLYELAFDADTPPAVKASIRSREPHDAIALAKRFGGGGHARAAGCTIHQPLEGAKQTIIEAVMAEYFR